MTTQNNYTTEPVFLIDYEADKEFDINNEDQITITVTLSKEAAEEGDVLKETETTITVEI